MLVARIMNFELEFPIIEGFHEWGYPNSWMVYKGKSPLEMDDIGYPYDETETPMADGNNFLRGFNHFLPPKNDHHGAEGKSETIGR